MKNSRRGEYFFQALSGAILHKEVNFAIILLYLSLFWMQYLNVKD